MGIFKRLLFILSATFLVTSFALFLPRQVDAGQFKFTSYTLAQEETINDDLYITGADVTVAGVVNGDLIVVGDTVNIVGTVTGDVYVFGDKVDVNASIFGTTFLFGNNVTLEGVFTQNIYTFSSFLSYDANTEKDLTGFFYDSTLKGSVGDDMRVFGYRMNVDSLVKGDLLLLSEKYILNEDKVTGEIYFNSTLKEIAEAQGVNLDETTYQEESVPSTNSNWTFRLAWGAITFISLSLVGFFLITIFPVKTAEIRKNITESSEEFLKSFGIGFAIAILIPLPLFFLTISFVGTPLAILLAGMLFFAMFFGRIWVEMSFGKEILELFGVKEYRPYKSFLVGRLVSTLICLIPLVSGFYNAFLGMVALGALVRVKYSYFSKARKSKK